jgi:hypothetical protein
MKLAMHLIWSAVLSHCPPFNPTFKREFESRERHPYGGFRVENKKDIGSARSENCSSKLTLKRGVK